VKVNLKCKNKIGEDPHILQSSPDGARAESAPCAAEEIFVAVSVDSDIPNTEAL
jgi:hypothetical protein